MKSQRNINKPKQTKNPLLNQTPKGTKPQKFMNRAREIIQSPASKNKTPVENLALQ